MSGIRPFEAADARAVASLWQYWFRDKTRDPDPDLVDLVERIYVHHPHRAEGVRPLVAVGDDGALQGFLGVTATPVWVDERPATLAGLFPSVVDPDAPSAVASLLLRTALGGPQAFSFSDGGHVKFERIWETLGGRIAHLASLRWVKLLRPAAVGTMTFAQGSRAVLRPLLRPLAAGADALARRAARERFTSVRPRVPGQRTPPPELAGEPLTPAAMLEANERLHRGLRLRPAYDEAYLAWLFAELRRIRGHGELAATLVRDPAGGVAGYHVAYLAAGGVSRVFALEAAARHVDGVVDHLFAQADAAGAAAVIGRLTPALRRPMAARGCLVHPGGSLLMLHARDASLMDAVELGRAALSRLDGENWFWWAIVGQRGGHV